METKSRRPKKLNNRHIKLCELLAQGAKQKKAAADLGYHPATVSRLLTYPDFKLCIQAIQKMMFEALRQRLVSKNNG